MKRHHRTCLWLLCCFVLLPVLASAQERRDAPIYRWTGSEWVKTNGYGSRISVAPDGSAWVVNAAGEIYHSTGQDQFERVPGTAADIAVGRDGTVWIIGFDTSPYRWRGNRWERVEGSNATAIAVDRTGEPWIVSTSGDVYRRVTGRFQKVEGAARDIGVDEDVWIAGTDGGVRQMSRNGRWSGVRGSATRISVSSRGPWVVNDQNQIYRWESGAFREMPGAALDVGVNDRGDAWVIGLPDPAAAQGSSQDEHRARRRRNP